MPRMTVKYPFEWKIFEWAGEVSAFFAGRTEGHTYIMTFNSQRMIHQITFDIPPGCWHEAREQLENENRSYLFFDPFDAPEYIWISWFNIAQPTMEGLLGAPFSENDFIPYNKMGEQKGEYPCGRPEFPNSWGVMF